MQVYRIKHIPTGLYYKPGEVNLSANGKVYTTTANVLTRACRGIVRLTVHKDSRLHKATKDKIEWKEAGYQCDIMIAHVPITEFEKEEI